MQRFLRQRRAKRHAPMRVVTRQRDRTAHEPHRAHAVPQARDVEHRCDVSHAFVFARHQFRACTIERQLRGRHFARAELFFQAVHADAVVVALGIARLQMEQCQAAPARAVAFRARQRQRDVGSRGGGKPLAAEQPPNAVIVAASHRLRQANVRATGGFRHPLPAGPRAGRIATGQARHHTFDQRRVASGQQHLGGTVGHRQGTVVNVSGGAEQICQGILDHTRILRELALISGGDESVLQRQFTRTLPQRRQLDVVDAVAPSVPLGELRLQRTLGQLLHVKRTAGELAQCAQARFGGAQHFGRQHAREQTAQRAIVVVLIP